MFTNLAIERGPHIVRYLLPFSLSSAGLAMVKSYGSCCGPSSLRRNRQRFCGKGTGMDCAMKIPVFDWLNLTLYIALVGLFTAFKSQCWFFQSHEMCIVG